MRHDEESAKTNETWEAAPQRIQRQTPHIAASDCPKTPGVDGIHCRTMRCEDARRERGIAGKGGKEKVTERGSCVDVSRCGKILAVTLCEVNAVS